MSDIPWPPPQASDNPPQQQYTQGLMRGLDIAATALFTIISLTITTRFTLLVNKMTGALSSSSSYAPNIGLHFLIDSALIATWAALGTAVAYAIIRLVRNKKAWWVPLAGLGISGICVCLAIVISLIILQP
ncbi:hypothetical protein [Rathayibacter toxicus]|uniref:hypothetical protein n=1 Tax=Rathayibacter toxicus TaxID=145458 RepID=UPI000CE7E420|nr:hypothetical protein [Rathayibacter toxicus]QOD10612.1 hypothetical protein BSG36_01000 [Rathayibacter toxicus]QWL27350.1 hypothetical protein E2R33_01005 [Rathayibacter toxicus]